MPFIDNIIIGSWVSEGEYLYAKHYDYVKRVMRILKADQFVDDTRKSKFFVKEVNFAATFRVMVHEDQHPINFERSNAWNRRKI